MSHQIVHAGLIRILQELAMRLFRCLVAVLEKGAYIASIEGTWKPGKLGLEGVPKTRCNSRF